MKKKLIILAAGQGTRLRPITDRMPKCMVPLAGKNLLEWKIETALKAGIAGDDIIVIGGYKADQINNNAGKLLINSRYAETNMVRTLWCAKDYFEGDIIVAYGDIVYTEDVFEKVLSCKHEIGVAVDHDWRPYWEQRFTNILSDAESLKLDRKGRIVNIGQKVQKVEEINGQYIGLMVFQGSGIKALNLLYEKELQCLRDGVPGMISHRNLDNLYMTDMLQGLIDQNTMLHEIPINGGWVEIDSNDDLQLAQEYCRSSQGNLIVHRH